MRNLILILIWIICSSCGRNIKEGTIVNKYYEPKHTYISFEINQQTGEYSSRKVKDDADYVFIIYGKDKDGNYKRERYEVNKNKYHRYEEGDRIKI